MSYPAHLGFNFHRSPPVIAPGTHSEGGLQLLEERKQISNASCRSCLFSKTSWKDARLIKHNAYQDTLDFIALLHIVCFQSIPVFLHTADILVHDTVLLLTFCPKLDQLRVAYRKIITTIISTACSIKFQNSFINCPIGNKQRSFFQPMLFTIHHAGSIAR